MRRILPVLLISAMLMDCGGTNIGNPTQSSHEVTLKAGTYTAMNSRKSLWDLLVPSAYAAVTGINLCFKRVRLKRDTSTADDSTGSANVDLSLDAVTLSTTGGDITLVTVPDDTYRRIEFDLDSHCTGGKSVQYTNGTGAHSTASPLSMNFNGEYKVSEGHATIVLDFQPFVNALNGINVDNDIKGTLQSTFGNF